MNQLSAPCEDVMNVQLSISSIPQLSAHCEDAMSLFCKEIYNVTYVKPSRVLKICRYMNLGIDFYTHHLTSFCPCPYYAYLKGTSSFSPHVSLV